MKSVVVFVVGGLVFGAISLGIGYAVAAVDALVQGGAAFGLTFVPASATLAWVIFSYRTNPEMQLLASLASSGVRMGVAAGGGFFLTESLGHLFDAAFWFWLVLFYMTFLAAEITLVVWQQPKTAGASNTTP